MTAHLPSPEYEGARTGAGVRPVVGGLHEALHALGALHGLRRVVDEIPDARERLAYVGGMTEAAAHKVLNLVDAAQPLCRTQTAHARQLASTLQRNAASGELSLEHARRLLTLCAGYAVRTAAHAEQQQLALTEIMLAQDFQDLSGQVIHKVIDMITRTEQQLVQVLADGQREPLEPEVLADVAVAHDAATIAPLEGPQTPDKALAQGDVDNLLASLGF